jgi:hypothetical protein
MTDAIQREIAEIERQRDAFSRLDRISAAERSLAILETKFAGAVEVLFKELARSVSAEDLRRMRIDWETALRDAMNVVSDLVKTANDQQSAAIISRVEMMLLHQHERAAEEAKRTRQEFIRYVVGFALTILSALLIFWITERA